MAKRINDLTQEATVTDGMFVEVDDPTFVESKKATVEEITETERTAREAQDDVIEAGAGLNADGTYTAPAGSNYMKAADFAAVPYTENIYNGLLLLDTQIKTNADNIDNTLNTSTVLLSVADINTLFTVPIVLVDASLLGVSEVIDVIEAVARIRYIAAAWEVGAQELEIYYDTGNTIMAFSNGFVEAASGLVQKITPTDQTNILLAKDIMVKLPTANPVGVGDGTISISVSYRIVEI